MLQPPPLCGKDYITITQWMPVSKTVWNIIKISPNVANRWICIFPGMLFPGFFYVKIYQQLFSIMVHTGYVNVHAKNNYPCSSSVTHKDVIWKYLAVALKNIWKISKTIGDTFCYFYFRFFYAFFLNVTKVTRIELLCNYPKS